jgi:signal transduction histidine kinase
MKSLRARLLLGLLTSSTLVLAANGFGLYFVMRARLEGELDRSLVDTLRSNAPNIAREVLLEVRAGRSGYMGMSGRRHPGGQRTGWEDADPGASQGGSNPPRPTAIPRPAERTDLMFQALSRDGEALLASDSLAGASFPRLAEDLPVVTYDKIDAGSLRFGWVDLPGTDVLGRAVGLALQMDPPEEMPGRGSMRMRPTPMRPPPIEIIMAIDAGGVAATLAQLRLFLVLGWLAASTIGAGVIVWLLQLGLAPVASLRQQIEEIDEAGPETRFSVPDAPSELLPVLDQLNALMGRMAAGMAREQEFAGHAAHELRTPLAGLRSTLEVALSRPRQTAEHVAASEQCLQITLQMQEMVEVLLSVVRNASPDESGDRQDTAIGGLLDASWAPWEQLAEQRRMTFMSDCNRDDVLRTDEGRLRMILTNLLGNAVDHGDEGGAISVALSRTAELVTLTVSNPAAAASSEVADRAFDAFWRGDEAREGTAQHSGLGLTLCSRLATSLGGELAAAYADGSFSVTLSLPDPG